MNCGHCQNNLIAYIDHDLPLRKMRQMSQHLQVCSACYAKYISYRDTSNQLSTDLALIGCSSNEQLANIWQTVHSELKQPPPTRSHWHWQQSMVALALAVLFVLPWSLNVENIATAAEKTVGATPAIMPHDVTPEGTVRSHYQLVALSFITPTETTQAQSPTATSTPAVAPIPNS